MTGALYLSDEAFEALSAVAAKRGQRPEALLQDWLAGASDSLQSNGGARVPARDGTDGDPLGPFLGAFEAVAPDVSRRHDRYLASAYADAHAAER